MNPTGNSLSATNLIASTNGSGSAQWWTWGVNTDNSFRINPGADAINNPSFVVTSGGNVGIGTTSPNNDKLDVNGVIAKETTTGVDSTFDNLIKYGYKSDLEGSGQSLSRWIGIDASITAGAAAANKMKFRVYNGGTTGSPADIMTLQGDGNVGIGTTNPGAKLDVNGTGNFSGTVTAPTFSGNATSAYYAY
jgi:hypothetical protein